MAFNKRLAPPRILGLPLGAAIAGLVTLTGALVSVVLPGLAGSVAVMAAIGALPFGIAAALVGDDVTFARVYWLSRRERRIAAREGLWL
ncbi:MAG: hypothetical protein ACYCTF_10250 [Acidiferrobacter sp.]